MVEMNKGTATLIGVIVGLVAGSVLTWLLIRQLTQTFTVAKKAIENIESWQMWEDEKGILHAEIHRKVTPVE